MLYRVDSYTLEYIETEDKYYISFLDSVNQDCKIEIEKEIFEIYMNSRKAYTKIKNETSRYLEHTKLTEEEIHNKAIYKNETAEDVAMRNIQKEKMKIALKKLTDTQYRRIELHIIDEVSVRDIAKLENVQKSQIEKSLKLGLKKLKKFFYK